MPRRRGRQFPKEFVVEKYILNAETVTAAGGSAVVIAARGAKDVMRKLLMEEDFYHELTRMHTKILFREKAYCAKSSCVAML